MTAAIFILLVVVTVSINIFVTAFLIARSSQSKKIRQELKNSAEDVMRQVTRATNTHLTISDGVIKDLTSLIEEARRCSDVLSRKVEKQKLIKTTSDNKDEQKKVSISKSRVKKASAKTKPKTNKKSKENISKIKKQSLFNNAEFKKLIRQKLSDEEIASHFNISKAEVSLARFNLKNSNKK